MTNVSPRQIISWATLLVMLFALWYWVLPPQLGGRTTFLTTRGISMEPLLHDGDLAVLHKQSRYKVGDIIKYHSQTLNAPVLHRIISIDDAGISTKGDNNNFVDLDHPKRSEINGKLVHTFNGAGRYAAWLKSVPVRIFGSLLIGWAVYHLVRGNDRNRRNNPIKGVETSGPPRWKLPSFLRKLTYGGMITVFASVTAVSIVLAGMGFSRPVGTTSEQETIYNLRGKFAYSAQAPGGDLIYRDGQVSTGDPIFLAMVNNLFVTFTFDIDSPARFKGTGTIGLDAVLKGKSGWSHTVPLAKPASFEGTSTRVSTVLDLKYFKRLTSEAQTLTKINDNNYTITLKPVVVVDGTLAGGKLSTTYAPELNLNATAYQMTAQTGAGTRDAAPSAANASDLNNLASSNNGTVTIPQGTPAQIKAFGVVMGIALLRVIGVVGILVGLSGLASLVLMRRREQFLTLPDHDRTLRKVQKAIVPVRTLSEPTSSVVEFASLSELTRLAETRESLIFCHEDDQATTYFVTSDGTSYRYIHLTPPAEHRFGAEDTAADFDRAEQ